VAGTVINYYYTHFIEKLWVYPINLLVLQPQSVKCATSSNAIFEGTIASSTGQSQSVGESTRRNQPVLPVDWARWFMQPAPPILRIPQAAQKLSGRIAKRYYFIHL
jgi:hypothetical protein